MTGSPFILAGVVVVIIAVVVGIVAAILKSRADAAYSTAPSTLSYEPNDDPSTEPPDLAKLDAIMGLGGTPSLAAPTVEPVVDEPSSTAAEPVDDAPSEETHHDGDGDDVDDDAEWKHDRTAPVIPEIVDAPERDEEPLPGLWAHLVATEEGPLAVDDRLDMVARLEMVGEKWCVDALQSAVDEEKDPQVNAAVRGALARMH